MQRHRADQRHGPRRSPRPSAAATSTSASGTPARAPEQEHAERGALDGPRQGDRERHRPAVRVVERRPGVGRADRAEAGVDDELHHPDQPGERGDRGEVDDEQEHRAILPAPRRCRTPERAYGGPVLLGADDPLPLRPYRVLVAGKSGAGKTILARRVEPALGLPRTELDALFHGPGWRPLPGFPAAVEALAARPAWVTEWQYPAARAVLAARADLLVWLDLPRAVVLRQVVARTVGRAVRREPLWHGDREPPLRTVSDIPWRIPVGSDRSPARRRHGRGAGAQRELRAAVRRAGPPGRRARAHRQGRAGRGAARSSCTASAPRSPVPSVVRLTRFVRVPYRATVPLTRKAVFARDGGRCVYCGAAATSLDHVVPKSRGGAHTWDNVVSACGRCNHVKADRGVAELGWRLRRRRPRPAARPGGSSAPAPGPALAALPRRAAGPRRARGARLTRTPGCDGSGTAVVTRLRPVRPEEEAVLARWRAEPASPFDDFAGGPAPGRLDAPPAQLPPGLGRLAVADGEDVLLGSVSWHERGYGPNAGSVALKHRHLPPAARARAGARHEGAADARRVPVPELPGAAGRGAHRPRQRAGAARPGARRLPARGRARGAPSGGAGSGTTCSPTPGCARTGSRPPTGQARRVTDLDPDLVALAAAHGVATSYEDWAGEPVPVGESAVVAALAAVGVEAATPAAVAAALRELDDAPWRRAAAASARRARGRGRAASTCAATARLVLELEDGSRREVAVDGPPEQEREGRALRRVALPALPLGWHRLRRPAATPEAVLVVAPAPGAAARGLDRTWGWMVQLYALRSAGRGASATTPTCARWWSGPSRDGGGVAAGQPAARRDAGAAAEPLAVLAVEPALPLAAVPARRGRGRARAALPRSCEAQVAALRAAHRPGAGRARPGVGREAGRARAAVAAHRADALAAFRAERGAALEDFALFCALAEEHGVPWQEWPEPLRRPDGAGVARARRELADRVSFWCWVQLLVDEQLAAVREASPTWPSGVVHDLAVGVDAGGADAWALQDALALGTTVGAPPDSFNQQGQDWGCRRGGPDRLRELGYAPYRDLVRGVLRHAGGIRIDHVMGLFRLWWVPAGASAAEGTYVSYDADAMLGVLALEAARAGAVVVGEDLGTVEDRVRTSLDARGVLGSAVLWFETDGRRRTLPPAQWRAQAMASVTTHDLPTAAGFLAEEHVRVRDELGQLGVPVEQERSGCAPSAPALLAMLDRARAARARGGDPVLAMHAALVASPCRVVLAGLRRRGRRPAPAEPAGHRGRVPQLAAARRRRRRPAAGAGGAARRARVWRARRAARRGAARGR